MMSMPIHTILRYKRKRQRQRKKKRERERGIRKKHEKQECKHRSASRDAPPADQKKVQTARNKNTPTILEKSSACQGKRHQGRQHVNSGISKEIEHPHDLNEHWKFCVKIYMQLAVSTRPHNTHQFGIGTSMERKKREKEKE